jgi:hypothetical protein
MRAAFLSQVGLVGAAFILLLKNFRQTKPDTKSRGYIRLVLFTRLLTS